MTKIAYNFYAKWLYLHKGRQGDSSFVPHFSDVICLFFFYKNAALFPSLDPHLYWITRREGAEVGNTDRMAVGTMKTVLW